MQSKILLRDILVTTTLAHQRYGWFIKSSTMDTLTVSSCNETLIKRAFPTLRFKSLSLLLLAAAQASAQSGGGGGMTGTLGTPGYVPRMRLR